MASNSSLNFLSTESSESLSKKQNKHARANIKINKVACNEIIQPGCAEIEKLRETISLIRKKNSELENENLKLKKII